MTLKDYQKGPSQYVYGIEAIRGTHRVLMSVRIGLGWGIIIGGYLALLESIFWPRLTQLGICVRL